MNNPSAKLVKIGEAAKILGVSIDTLRRWEKAGKIEAIRTPGGTRLFKVGQHQTDTISTSPKSFVTKFLIGTAVLSVITLALTAWIAASYLTAPKDTQRFFKNNIASPLLSPFHKLAESFVAVISPSKAKFLGFLPPKQPSPVPISNDNILAVTASPQFLEVNSDTQINGSLFVRDSINGAVLEATPSSSTITLASGDTTLTVSDSAEIDQDVSTTSTPTFSSLTLSSTTSQLSSGGFQFTLPGATTTLVGIDTTQTLTKKSLSGSANTFTNIPNSALVNSKVTVTAGTNLTGGGDVNLGSSITIALKDSPTISGVVSLADGTAAAPSLTFTNDADTGLYRIGSNSIGLITAGSATSGITINGSGNVGIGTITPTSTLHVVGTGNITSNATIGGTLGVTGATTLSSTLTVTGNTTVDTNTFFVDASNNRVGIGTTTPGSTLGINGNVGIGVSYSTLVTPSNGLAVEGNVGVGITTANSALTVNGAAVIGTGYNLTAPTNGLLVQGLVGIGNTAPGNTLAVNGGLNLGTFASVTGPSNGLAVSGNIGVGVSTVNSNLAVSGNGVFGTGYAGMAGPSNGLLIQGLVGIGNTAPGNTLAVTGGLNLGTYASSTGPSNGLAVSGNVGIGTTSPATPLHIIGNTTTRGHILADINNLYDIGSAAITYRTIYANEVNATTLVGTLSAGNLTASTFTINSDNSTDDAEDANLRFYRGSASPHALMTWDSTTKEFDLNSQLHLTGTITSTNGIMLDSVTNDIITPGNETLALIPGGTGNVGINTTSPYAKLQVRGAGTGTGISFLTTDSSGAQRLTVLDNGNVGIGVTNPSASLTVHGNVGIGFTNVAIPSSGLAVSGNVGIGITTANSTLSVAGSAHIGGIRQGIAAPTNGLFVDGNVGIGATTSSNILDVWGNARITGTLTVDSTITPQGQILASDGTASAPGYSFTNDTNTGIFRPSADALGFSTGGTSRLTITAAGNVGIGYSAPTAQLYINPGAFDTAFKVDASNPTVIATDGNVGIGFTSPDRPLQIASSYNLTGSISSLLGSGGTQFAITGNLAADLQEKLVIGLDGDDNFGVIQVGNTSGTAYPLSLNPAGGNVGIGITTANSTLSVAGSAHIGGIRQGIAAPTNGLFVDGNVGIGATASAYNLDVWGTGRFSSALTVAGNLGVGTSLTVDSATSLNTLNVSSISSLSGNVGIGSSLTVTSGVNLLSSLRVAGNSQLSTLSTSGDITNSGVYLASAGSASAPSYSFTLDPDTGIYNPGANALGLTTGGVDRLRIDSNGNIGIGASLPQAKLVIQGNVGIGYTGLNQSIPANGLAVSGNVGVGTTSPLGALHVVGQCVAKGTRIRRKRKARFAKRGARGKGEEEWEEVPVEEIKPDDEILSLNEKKGEFEWHKVEKTMDMGVQEVFRLETEFGKWIETTANHPYLVKIQNSLPANASVALQAGHQKTALADGFNASVDGKPTIVSPAELSIIYHKTAGLSSVKNASVDRTGFEPAPSAGEAGGLPLAYRPKFTEALPLSQIATSWVKVSQLKKGMEIATVNGWEKIVSITNAGRIQTYDLQIANTHNFLANNIVAHNTYINGNLGIGAYSGLTVPTNGLAVSGNVGIGITTANSTLSVAGSAHIGSLYQGTAAPTDGLYVDGNVGIGATTSSNILDVWGNSRLAGTLTLDSNLTLSGGQFLANNGTSSLPSYSFTNSTSTGLYSPSVNALALNTNGASTPPLTITAGGFVGIGVTAPLGYLQVRSSLFNTTAGHEIPFIIASDDEIGIGTSDPQIKLHIKGGHSWGTGIRLDATALGGGRNWLLGNTAGDAGEGQGKFIIKDETAGLVRFLIDTAGNIGIGFSSPDRLLQTASDVNPAGTNASLINTAGTTQLSLTGSTANTLTKKLVLGIDTTDNYGVIQAGNTDGTNYDLSLNPAGGNVGVGTTSPLQALHVVGQCVAKGTRIRRRRKGTEDEWEEVPVEDIKPDDEILSLNDATGEFEWHKVEKTMDMGIQEVFRLETESGKWIETTSNHPYLTKDLMTFGRLFLNQLKSNNSQKHHYEYQSGGNLSSIKNFPNFFSIHNDNLSNRIPISKATIASITDFVKNNTSILVKPGAISTKANQAADRFPLIPESTLNSDFIFFTLSDAKLAVNQGEKWIKVSQIKVGMEIATADGWEKIVSIINAGRVQTYDLQIENTHNFVGNNIVAHNTYITGNVGLGVTTPGSTLSINGNSVIGYSGVNIAGPSSGLAVSGNVGIGTTTTAANLDIINTNIANAGKLVNLTGTFITSSASGTGTGLNLTFTNANSTNADTAYGILSTIDDSAALANTVYGGYFDAKKTSGTGNSSLTLTGVYGTARPINTAAATTYGTAFGGDFLTTLGGVTNQTVTSAYGVRGQVTIGSGTSTITNLYGGYFNANTSGGGGSTPSNMYGVYIANPASGGLISGNKTGLYVETQTGGDNNYTAIFAGGNVGIGVSSPGARLQINGNQIIGFNTTTALTGPTNGLAVSGNVGIGITTANSALTVNGGVSIGSSYNVTAPTNGLLVQGNVGIGTTIPTFALSLGLSSSTFGMEDQTSSNTAGGNLTIRSGAGLGSGNGGTLALSARSGGTTGAGGAITLDAGAGGSSSGAAGTITITGGTAGATSVAGGNVNIRGGGAFADNTIASGDVILGGVSRSNGQRAGNIQILGDNSGDNASGSGGSITITGGTEGAQDALGTGGPITITGGTPNTTRNGGAISITTGPGGSSSGNSGALTLDTGTVTSGSLGALLFKTGGNTRMTVTGAGLVGIGITSPSQIFQVNSGASSTVITSTGNVGIGITTANSALTVNGGVSIGSSNITAPTNGLFVLGNVGIGFSTPDRLTQLASDINITSSIASLLGAAGTQFSLSGSSATGLSKKLVLGIDTTDNYGVIQAGNTDGTNYALALNPAGGNVGIGTTSPLGIFEVNPTAATSGNGAPILLTAQQGSSTGTGGAITLTSGTGGATSGASGGITLQVGTPTSGNAGALQILGAAGVGSNNVGSTITVTAGASVGSGTGGAIDLNGGVGGATSGTAGGAISLTGGTSGGGAAAGTGGAIVLGGGTTGTSVVGAAISITAGTGSNNGGATGGAVTIAGGLGGGGNSNGGAVIINGGAAGGLGSNVGGAITITSGAGLGSQTSGITTVTTGAPGPTGASGALNLTTGAGGSTSGNSGDLTLRTGSITGAGNFAGSINFQTGGTTTRVFIDNAGNVGIGASNPATAKLSVQGNVGIGYTSVSIPVNGLAVSGNVGIGITTANSTLSVSGSAHIGSLRQGIAAPTDGLFVDGNVGIGATSTAYNLDVWGTARFSSGLTLDGNLGIGGSLNVSSLATFSSHLLPSSDDSYDLGSNSSRWRDLYLGPATMHIGTSTSDEYALTYDTTNNRLGFNVNDSGPAEIVMDSSGNLGIGTTNPGSLLTVTGGNVGIGTSAAGAALQVNGAGLIGWGTASVAAPAGGLAISGNVGVGTTSPLQALHVVGQCVAKGTRIRRRRRGSGAQGEDEWEEIPVEDIRPDDEILSLNDATGAWEWHKVEKTMDMGIQEVFRLETEGGKWIETTSNHPYLALDSKQINHSSQQESYSQKSKSYTSFIVDIFNHFLGFGNHNSLNINERTNANIPLNILYVNNPRSNFAFLDTIGTMITALPIQAADKFIDSSDNVANNLLSTTWSTNNSISQAKWTKVSQLKAGQLIATEDGWEKIIAITPKGRVQTYDLQIENTHNFVGNNIVAHNTYITGNVGLGVTTPGSTLSINGNSVIGYSGVNIAGPSSGLAVSGNVGIGITTANSALTVNGGVSIGSSNIVAPTNGLFVLGNVGIGFTTPDRLTQLASDINITSSIASLLGAAGTQFAITGSSGTGGTEKKLVLGLDTTDNYGVIQAGNVGIGLSMNIALNPAGGNIGIGTTNPNKLLHVLGTARITDTISSELSYDPINQNLTYHLPFTENTGTITADRSTSANDAVLQASPNTPTWAAGKFGSALDFDGTNDFAESPALAFSVSNTANWTISAFVKNDTLSGYDTVIAVAESTAYYIYFGTEDTEVIWNVLKTGNTGRRQKTNGAGLATGKYYHLVMTKTGNNDVKIYVNGMENTTRQTQGSDTQPNVTNVTIIGRQKTADVANYFDGTIDEVKTWARALSVAEIQDLTKRGADADVPIITAGNIFTTGGNVGIGTTTANSTLSVAGSAHIGSLYQGTPAPANGLFVDGNVGIGATSTTYNLDVWGTGRFTSALTVGGNLGIGGSLNVSSLATFSSHLLPSSDDSYDLGSNTFRWRDAYLGPGTLHIGTSISDEYTLSYDTTANALGFNVNGSGANEIVFDSSGNVGIGTTTPNAKLDIRDGKLVLTDVDVGHTMTVIEPGNVYGALRPLSATAGGVEVLAMTDTDAEALWLVGGIGVTDPADTTAAVVLRAFKNDGGGSGGAVGNLETVLQVRNLSTNLMTVLGNGNVGINTVSPGSLLGVNGAVAIGTFSTAVAPSNGLAVSGNVGIGITTPLNSLHIYKATETIDIGTIVIDSTHPNLEWLEHDASVDNRIWQMIANSESFFLRTANDARNSFDYMFSVTGAGNVGIGTTNVAGAPLQVNGGGIFWPTTASLTGPANGLAVSGNVGVGTTSPLQALHVVGQCVAKGTRIRRRRKGTEDEWEEVPVEDIRPGDEILSLNDKTGEWEWHKVEKTMDMGIQEVFRLKTESGKWIETTSNHPYLVLQNAAATKKSARADFGDPTKVGSDLAYHLNSNIPQTNLDVKSDQTSVEVTGFAPAGPWMISQIPHSGTPTLLSSISQGAWIKVKYLKPGMMIATADGWEKISAKYSTGRVQTYDLQIANTHNFVGNDIVAHNTYITGNVGLGVTTPGSTLSINGNSVIGYSGVNIAGPSSGLAVSGNIGIGITTANSALTVNGGVSIGSSNITAPTNGLFVLGNVGIGFTTPDRLVQIGTDLSPTVSIAGFLGSNGSQFDITGSTANNLTKKLTIGLDTTNNYGYLQAGNTSGTGYPLTLNPAGGNVGIGTTATGNSTLYALGTAATSTVAGGDITLIAGSAGNAQTAGSLLFQGGDLTPSAGGSGTAGTVTIRAGNVITPGNTNITGSALNLTGGQGLGNNSGGAVNITGGVLDVSSSVAQNGAAGAVNITGGSIANSPDNGGFGVGGLISLTGGTGWASKAGGAITLTGGTPGNTGIGGVLTFVTGAGGSTSGNSGDLTLRTGAITGAGNFAGSILFQTNGANTRMFIDNAGNVGIGASNPATAKLSIQGNVGIGYTSVSIPVNGLAVSGNVGIGITTANSALTVNGGVSIGSSYNVTAPTNGLLVQGNVGIGVSTPKHQLSVGEVPPDAGLVTIRGYSNTPTAWKGGAAFGYTSASVIMGELNGVAQIGGHNSALSAWGNLGINTGGGNVGIGFTSPAEKLHIQGSVDGGVGIFTKNTNTGTSAYEVIRLGNEAHTAAGMAIHSFPSTFSNALSGYAASSGNISHWGSNGLAFGSGGNFRFYYNAGDDSAHTELVRITSAGNVGIGWTSPLSLLSVSGNLGIGPTSARSRLASGTYLATDGNVGIGITTANSALTVNGGVSIGSSFNVTAPTNGLIVQGNVGIGFTTPIGQVHITTDGIDAARGVTIDQHNDGIQAALLSLRKTRGTLAAPTTVANGDYSGVFTSQNYDGTAYRTNANIGTRITGSVSSNSIPNDIFFATSTTSDTDPYANGTVRMVVTSGGNVGIGFTTPDRLLQTASDINIVGSNSSLLGAAGTQFSLTGSSATGLQKKLVLGIDTTDNYGVIQAGNTSGTNYDLALNPAGGNVGIGTTGPVRNLHVYDNSASHVEIRLEDATVNSVPTYAIINDAQTWSIQIRGDDNDKFQIRDETGSSDPRFTIDLSGNVGINTVSPGSLLGVNGSLAVGTFSTAAAPSNGLAVSGNVGVGTTTANSALEVAGAGAFNDGTASLPALTFRADTDTGLWRVGTNLVALTTNGSGSLNAQQTINGLSIDSSGNIGIGTTNPGASLQINIGSLSTKGSIIRAASSLINGIVSYWKFNENTGSSVYDSTNYANTGTWSGTLGSQWASGKINAGGNFNGTNNLVTTTTNPVHGTTQFSISLWFKTNTVTSYQNLIGNRNNPPISGLTLAINEGTANGTNDNSIVLCTGYSATAQNQCWSTPTNSVSTATWYNVVLIWQNGSIPLIYLNNVSQTLTYWTGSPFQAYTIDWGSTNYAFGIGDNSQAYAAGEFTNGNIDEVGLWNRAIASGEVSSLYNSGNGLSYQFQSGNLLEFQNNPGIPTSIFDGSGNLGIGTTSTLAGLNIASNALIGFGAASGTAGPVNGLAVSGNVGIGTTLPQATLVVSGNVGIGYTGLNQSIPANGLAVSGNVGVGTTTASAALHVIGSTTANAQTFAGIFNGGNVGIGTTAPNALLVVGAGTNAATARTYIDTSGNVGIGTSATGSYLLTVGTTATGQFRVSSTGNVGIGTTYLDTGYLLDVGGKVRATGYFGLCNTTVDQASCNQDVAEIYSSLEDVEPGDLLVVSNQGKVAKSTTTYQPTIMGIVSSSPGLLLGINGSDVALGSEASDYPQNADPRLPAVALSGKVPLKVSTENGPIQIGDYLTSSSTRGVAMKALRPGPVIGKALEPFDGAQGDQGRILVFVNVSYADPGNFLASLSLDSDGNLIIPKIKTSSIILDPSVATTAAQLSVNSYQLTVNEDPNYTQAGPTLASNSNTSVDLSGKLASLEERIVALETKVAQEATSSASIAEATPSAVIADVKLTSPDILLATPSATLADLNTYSEATVSGMLTAYQAEIQDSFKVFGKTTLGQTSVAGDLNVDGTLSIENGSELNVIGTLYLQKSYLAGKLDIFDGKVVIDNSGNIKTTGEIAGASIITNKLTISNTPIASSSASLAPTIGTGKILAGQTSITVNTSQASSTAKIFITPRTKIGTQSLVVDSVTAGTGFTVSLDYPLAEDVSFDWWIVESSQRP